MQQEPNIYDPRSPDYAYASRSSSNKYRKQIDSEYGVPDEYVQERKRLEKKAFDLVGQITDKYYQQILNLAGEHQPSNAPQQAMGAPTQAGPPSAGYVQGKPPGWRGVRGVLRWLWYGKHADNPDYAPYEMNPGEEPPVQREWASLSEYATFLERAEIAADQIAQELFGNILSEENSEFKQKIANLLAQFKNELISYVIRPMFHQFWRIGLHRGIEMKGGEQGGSNDDSATEPVSKGDRPDGAARETGSREPQSDVEPVSSSKPSQPPKNPKDEPVNDEPVSTDGPATSGTPSSVTASTAEAGAKNKKKRNRKYGDIIDAVEESGLTGPEIYSSSEIMSKIMSIDTARMKENALQKIHEEFPLEWKDIESSLKAFVDSGLANKPGGIESAINKVVKQKKKLSPEQVVQEISDNPMISHLWRIQGGIASGIASMRDVKDEIIDLESKAIRNKINAKLSNAQTTPKEKESEESEDVKEIMAKPRGKKNRRKPLDPEDVKRIRQEAEKAEREESNRKARERRAAKKAEAAKEAEKKIEKATSNDTNDTNSNTTNVDDDIVTKTPKAGASKSEVQGYIEKAVKQSKSDDPDWIQKTKQDLWRLLDSWIGDDNERTDWINDEVDKAAADLYAGGSFDDDMASDMENLGDRDVIDDRSNEAMVHMIGRKWLNSLTLEARKRYYKIMLKEGRIGPYVQRSVVDRMPLQERNNYYRELLKG